MRETDIFAPLGWRLSCVDGRKDHVDQYKNEPWEETFPPEARTTAEQRKMALQQSGIVACLTPIYLATRARNKARRASQVAPFGPFNKEWKPTP